jgi:hypothetical protein
VRHWPLPLLLSASLLMAGIYARSLLPNLLLLAAMSTFLAFLAWRYLLLRWLQARWVVWLGHRRRTRLQHLWQVDGLSSHEGILLAYASAAASLAFGLASARFLQWKGTSNSFIVNAVTFTAISTPFTILLSLSVWMALASRLHYVDRETGETDQVVAFFPMNYIGPLGAITSLLAVLSLPLQYPVTINELIQGGFFGLLAIIGAFVPAFAVAYAYAIFAAEEDGQALRQETGSHPVRKFGDED